MQLAASIEARLGLEHDLASLPHILNADGRLTLYALPLPSGRTAETQILHLELGACTQRKCM